MSMKKHKARQQTAMEGGGAGTHLDSEEQQRLRNVVLEELAAVLRKHKCGGSLFISSFNSSAWRHVVPEWAGLENEVAPDGRSGLRVRINTKSPEAQKIADATMGHIGSMRDMCMQAFIRFEAIWKMVVRELGGEENVEYKFADMFNKPKPPKGSA